MGGESADIGEGSVVHASRGTAVMHQLAHIRPTAAHPFKPGQGKAAQRLTARKPGFDRRVSPHRAGKAEEVACGRQIICRWPCARRHSAPWSRRWADKGRAEAD